MAAAIILVQTVAGFGLIIFGAWVTWKGIRIITQYYPLTLKPGEPLPQAFTDRGQPANLVTAMMSLVNAEIASLSTRKRTAAFVDLDADGTPGGAGQPAGEISPEVPGEPAEPVEPVKPVATASAEGCETKDILEGVAGVIDSLPKLLNANFGPATVVCLVGLLIIAGGFYLLLNLSAV